MESERTRDSSSFLRLISSHESSTEMIEMPLRSGNAYLALPPLPPLVSIVTTTFQSPGRDVTSTTLTSRWIASTIPFVSSPNLLTIDNSMANNPLFTQTSLFLPALSLSNSLYSREYMFEHTYSIAV